MNYEELLKQISKSGPGYRWTITILLSVLSMKSAFDMFVTNLATASVPFHCAQAIVDNQTLSWTDVLAKNSFALNFSIEQFTCRAPRFWRGADGLLNLEDDFQNDSSSAAAAGTEKCEAWQFNPDHPDRWTMLIEYEMVCDRQYLNDRMQTVLQFGVFLSTLVGPLGDLLGRKTVLVAFCYLNLACNLAVVFVKDLTAQMVLRFFMGCGDPALLMGLILITELVGENYRSLHGNMFWMTWVVAYSSSAAISYYMLNWRHQMMAVVVITGLSFATYIPVLPESPRWLLTRGKTRRAEKILRQVCKFSGCPNALDKFELTDNEFVNSGEDSASSRRILKCLPKENIFNADYLITLAVVTVNFFTAAFVYHAMCFQRDFITLDPYLNVLISGLLEVPAYLIAWQMINRIGRKPTTVITMCFCGLGLILMPFIPRDPSVVFQAHSCVAIAVKFSITVAYSELNVYGSEVLPTTVRSCSLFFAFSVMGLGQFMAPELGGILSQVYPHLPSLLYGSVTVLAGLAALLLPESRGRAMPNTVAQMRPVGCRCGGRGGALSTGSALNDDVISIDMEQRAEQPKEEEDDEDDSSQEYPGGSSDEEEIKLQKKSSKPKSQSKQSDQMKVELA
ncbi:hypothetical protein BOX15_Mlig023248g1 [Macrostomum lignano]|uniref:Major facilitator superfamily (MFS) profile domain-containing protein n=1 Tax=Macrostomum lignano TaxID=282301 RepID=A0A267FKC3_9PLAT|nr:hypothetical protein BOX15_Mlig023248g1 [Macrostomum lignano]